MRILVYAPVDLNLIDGSAIWCASVVQMLLHDPQLRVDLLANTPLRRTLNIEPLASDPRVQIVDPWRTANESDLRGVPGKLGPRLTPLQALELILRLHADRAYGLLILRGGAIGRLAAETPHLAARSWLYLTQHAADPLTIAAIARSNARLACQTPLLQEYFENVLGTDPERFVPLPPMVPGVLVERPYQARRGRTLCYVGKFDADYRTEELVAAFVDIRRTLPDAQLVVAGDKFHDPDHRGEFEQRMSAVLTGTPGVTWRGGLPRSEVGRLMLTCDVGSCWRTPRYDASLEISTKALEYAAAGLPVLLNPSRINRLVFGDDYPLYVDSPESFVDRLLTAWQDDVIYARASEIAFETCQRFTFRRVNETLQPHLGALQRNGRRAHAARPRRLLFAGHDFKFCGEIIDYFSDRPDCLVRTDTWDGHVCHDERRSAELLRWADVVWCEWCLGNAAWYSTRVHPGQRLLVRLQRQEVTTQFPGEVHWPSVDHLIFTGPAVPGMLLERLGRQAALDSRLVYNTFACGRFDHPKTTDSGYRLGMLGYCPKLKHPRLALEILEHLRAHDPRWQFVLAGRSPQSFPWLWPRAEEREYYERFEQYVAEHALTDAVVRQDWLDDVARWYAEIGFILSCSDVEGSHQVVAEGMAAGCIPVVRRWSGASELYPNSLLFDDPQEAARLILDSAEPAHRTALIHAAQSEARARFDTSVIVPKLAELVLGPKATEPCQEAAAATSAYATSTVG
jgi:glycosyltransferase involved in cell wall biosynthesis